MADSSGKSTGLANLKPWLPGQSGNPKGKKALTDAEKKAKESAKKEVVRYQIYKDMNLEQLKKLDLSSLPSVDVIIVRKIMEDIKRSDTTELHRMWNRQLGAPKPDGDTGGLNITGSKVTIRIAAGQSKDSEDGA